MNPGTQTLDVRDDIRSGREPFSKIMSAVAGLQLNQELLLITPFEPIPLYAVMKKQGFRYASHAMPSGDWEVLFTRQTDTKPPLDSELDNLDSTGPGRSAETRVNPTAVESNVLEVDARGLEPPQPMVKILETLARLPQGALLKARTDRRPMHLYTQLEQRGFTAETKEQADGSFITHIRRR